MVLRLLAFNAEAWLAEHFNAYLADPNQYRAILRNLLHLGGHVAYTSNAITITDLGPARQPTSRPRPPTPHRRTQRHTSGHAHRPPATDLPARTGVNLNGERVTTQGGLSLSNIERSFIFFCLHHRDVETNLL